MGDLVPDPTTTAPYPMERDAVPAAPHARRPPRRPQGSRFSAISFVLGVLLGVVLTSCLSGLGFAAMLLFP